MIFLKTATFSALGEKQVVNCRNGKIMGFVADAKIDIENGKILSLFVCESTRIPLFTKPSVTEIPWDRIEKVGDDIIIVDTECFLSVHEKPKKEKKYLFGG